MAVWGDGEIWVGPGVAAGLEDRLEVIKDSVGEEVILEKFPDYFLGIEFGTGGRERGDILWDLKGSVPGSSIQDPRPGDRWEWRHSSPEDGVPWPLY